MSKVKVEIDAGDAEATYKFLRNTVIRIHQLTADMEPDRQKVYHDQPDRWDRVAIALGHAVGERGLKPIKED